MKDEFEIYEGGIKPVKSRGTRWIDYQIRAIQCLVDKYGLYCEHLQHTIPQAKKKKKKIVPNFKESLIN